MLGRKDERIEIDVVAELKEEAEKLPFAKNHKIITKLFLKSTPAGTQQNVLPPNDMIGLL